jgi:hypothetical protein
MIFGRWRNVAQLWAGARLEMFETVRRHARWRRLSATTQDFETFETTGTMTTQWLNPSLRP